MKRSRTLALTASVVVLLAVVSAWFSPFGSGEYVDSPDGTYRAYVSNFRRGTWLHGPVDYIEIKIVEIASGKAVWGSQRNLLAGEETPEYGDRSAKFIKWAPDSRSVSVPVVDTTTAVYAVP